MVFKIIWNIIKGIWFSFNFIRKLIFGVLAILIIVIIIVSLPESPKLTTPSALVLNISGTIADHPQDAQFIKKIKNELFKNAPKSNRNSLFDIISTIENAKSDNRITGLVLNLDNFVGADLPSLQYIGKYLEEFKSSGKPIFAIGQSFTQSQYYLASYADKIYLTQLGGVNLFGMSAQNLYFKSLLDKLGVNVHVFRVGKYKSAVEPYMLDKMSTDARKNTQQWLYQQWQIYLSDISKNRHLRPRQIYQPAQEYINDLENESGDVTNYALIHQLVDKISSFSDFRKDMANIFGFDNLTHRFNQISLSDYESLLAYEYTKPQDEAGNKIAVIFVSGMITDDEQNSDSQAVASDIIYQIQQAKQSHDVKAVVLRINSPGGSVTASENIRNELISLVNQKPVVVSMGGLAASGGYWISTPAKYIIASPTTITGSIGIYGIIPTFEKTLSDIGVQSDGVKTSPLAGVSVAESLSPEFEKTMQLSIEHGYRTFLSIVAQSRKMTVDQVNEIAQGQVWNGQDALKNHLVDQLGDFDDALTKAAELAGLSDYSLVTYHQDPSYLSSLLFDLQNKIGLNGMLNNKILQPYQSMLKSANAPLDLIQGLTDPQHRYVYCLDCQVSY